MPRNGGTSNRKQNKTEAGKEMNARIPERLPDQALPVAAQSPIHVSMPSLVSYIQRQFRHIGESSNQLITRVLGQVGLPFNVSRAIHLPLLSRALDYIQRKITFVPPVWQRTLELPWFRRHLKPRRSFTQTTGAVADRKLTDNISLQPNEVYPDMLPQTLSDAGEEQAGDEADETYVATADETYPSIIRDLISPPPIRRIPLTMASDLPHAGSAATLPPHTRQTADSSYAGEVTQPLHISRKEQPARTADETYPAVIKNLISPPVVGERLPAITSEPPQYTGDTDMPPHTRQTTARGYTGEVTQPLHVSRKEQPARTADETYPTVIKNLISPPIVGERLPDTTPELPHHAGAASMPLIAKPTIDSLETEGSSEFVPSSAEQSGIPTPGAYRAYQTPEPDRTQARAAEDRPTQVSWQPQYTFLKQGLSRVLKTIAQRMPLPHKPLEARPHLTEEGISEGPASPIRRPYSPKAIETEVESISAAAKPPTLPSITISKMTTLHRATVKFIHPLRTLASSKQPAMLKRESLVDTSTAPRQPAFTREEPERPEPSAIQRTADGTTKPMPDLLPSETGTYGESTEVLPGEVTPQPEPQISQVPQWKPLISLSLKGIRKKLETIYTARDMTMGTLRPAMVNLETPQYGIIHPVFRKGHTEKPPFYSELSSVAGPDIQQSPAQEIIQHKMISSTPKFFKPTDYTSPPDNTENYRFLPSQESLAFPPDYRYTRRETLDMPPLSLVQPKRDFSAASSEELFTDMPSIMPEPVYSRKQGAPELLLAPISYTPVTSSSQIARVIGEPSEMPAAGEGAEGEAETDIDDIANDVYRILKWRLSAERERALGVY